MSSPVSRVHVLSTWSPTDITSAFDPIFFMHHANIDRICRLHDHVMTSRSPPTSDAFWEYIYPDPWLDQGYYNKGDPENHPFCTCDGSGDKRNR
jgi:hypothetical protein